MKVFALPLIALALTLSATSSKAQKETPPEGGSPHNFTLPSKQEFSLPNGLHASMVPYGEIPKVTVYLVIQTGNVHEQDNQNGLADMVGQLMREGTTSLTGKQISDKVAGMGGSVDVSVGSNQTIISGSVLSEFGPELVSLIAELVQKPSFPATEFERIKNDFKRNMNLARSQPGTQADVKFRSIIYAGHPYGRDIPSDEMINSFTVDQVKMFYQQQYGAQRSNVYVAGKFDSNAMEGAIKNSFKDWTKGPEKNIPVAKPVSKAEMAIIDRPGAPQSTIVMGLPVPPASDPDYMRMRVMNSLLGGSFGSRITRNIREEKGYTYSPYSSINARYRVSEWVEDADVTTEYTGASLSEIMKEIRRLQNEAPAADELKGIQNYEAGLFVLRNSTPAGIIGQLNFLDLHGLPDTFLTNQVQNIHAVTPAQVQEVAKKYIRPADMSIVIVGDKKVIDPQIKKFQSETKAAR